MVELLPWIVLGNVLGTTSAYLTLRHLARHNGDNQALGAWSVPAALLALAGLYLGGQGTAMTITAILTFGVVVSIGVRVIPSIKNPMPQGGPASRAARSVGRERCPPRIPSISRAAGDVTAGQQLNPVGFARA